MPLETNPGHVNEGAEGVTVSGEGKGTNVRHCLSGWRVASPLFLTRAQDRHCYKSPLQKKKLKLHNLLMETQLEKWVSSFGEEENLNDLRTHLIQKHLANIIKYPRCNTK